MYRKERIDSKKLSTFILSLLLSPSSDVSVLDEECLDCDEIIASEVRGPSPHKTQQELYLEGYQHQHHQHLGKLNTD